MWTTVRKTGLPTFFFPYAPQIVTIGGMLRSPLRRAYARYGPRYARIAAVAQFQLSHLVAFGGLLLYRREVA